MMDTNGYEISEVVEDTDGYVGRITGFVVEYGEVCAVLDYSEFSADVPPEAENWPVTELARIDES